MANITDLEQIIKLMVANKLYTVKFGDIEVCKNIYDVKGKAEKTLPMKSFNELTEDEQLFDPTKGIGDGK